MSRSKCYLCNKRLKGGDGMLRTFPDGVHKICKDFRGCEVRKRQKEIKVPDYEEDKAKEETLKPKKVEEEEFISDATKVILRAYEEETKKDIRLLEYAVLLAVVTCLVIWGFITFC